ncbi:glycosyltransferase family 2 protein [Thermodesulfobacteriota bacterium]
MEGNKVTISIVTKIRPYELRRCLQSIATQSIKAGEVIIVDNDPCQSAREVYVEFKEILPIKYLVETQPGTPQARNKALANCETDYCAFIDDDCVLDERWMEAGLKAIKNDQHAYIVGTTLLLNDDNIISQAQHLLSKKWIEEYIGENNKIKNIDTKNTILKIILLNKYNLLFDEKFFIPPNPSGEDEDLAMNMNEFKLSGYYEKRMKVFHEEIDEFWPYIRRAYGRGKSSFLLYKKWRSKGYFQGMDHLKFFPIILNPFRCLINVFKEISGGCWYKFKIFVLVYLFDCAHVLGFLSQKRKGINV